jgi:hypothetical protein
LKPDYAEVFLDRGVIYDDNGKIERSGAVARADWR